MLFRQKEKDLRKYNRSEVETLHVGKIWWMVDVHPVFELDCFKNINKNRQICSMYDCSVIDHGCGTSGFGIIQKYCIVILGLGIHSSAHNRICCRSCTEDHSDKGTLVVISLVDYVQITLQWLTLFIQPMLLVTKTHRRQR